MMKRIYFSLVLSCCLLGVSAQRVTDMLDRGLVAVPAQSGGGNLVSWRIFAEEYYDTEYNLYCNGSKLNSTPLKVSNYQHSGGNASSRYQVAAVVRGVEQEKCDIVTRWNNGYYEISVKGVTDRKGTNVTSHYIINDISLADVNGDGKVEFIVKRLSDLNYDLANKTAYNLIECYDLNGNRLWWIDCGPNLLSGSNVELNAVAYDWDMDGRAEVLMRGADNMIIHTANGTTVEIGDMNADTRWNGMEYTNSGREFLLYLDGQTAEPYPIGPNGRLWMDYPLPRYDQGETTDLLGSSAEGNIWGAGIAGHRPTKHFFGAPFLDGRKPSIFLGRGIYSRTKMVALDVDPATHQLTERWRWKEYNSGSPWFGQGYHNYAIADVDWDGRDEIVYGSMVIDDNGKGLSTTGLGHGDAQHCSDLDPYRHGQEQFACNETSPAMNYRDATTSKIYYRLQSTGDDGRALCANFTNDFPGSIGRSTQSGMVSCVADKVVSEKQDMIAWNDLNFRIYWDGDLLSEVLNSPGTEKEIKIEKPGVGRIFTSSGVQMCNWTKNTPSAQGDIFGDWREEIVVRADGNTKIRIYTSPYYTQYRNYTLWHDHQYRQAMVWQMCGYNQPPHPSYFLGEMEGITQAPPPLTMTGRVEIKNGGTISSANDDKHVIVCETNNSEVTVADGAKPYIATFNVPSWVQGTNSSVTNGKGKILYEYYTCTVNGAAFTGDMRLVKQGDGILTLPTVEQTYTGNTDIWAGTLNFDGKLLQSDLWLNRFAELNSDGGEFKSIRMDYDAKLRPGGADKQGELKVGALTLGFGSRVIFDIYNEGGNKADLLKAEALTIQTKNWKYGPQYLTPVFEFTPHLSNGETLEEGRYLIGEVGNITGELSNIKLEGLGNSHKTQLIHEDGKLYLEVTGLRDASTVYWNGNESSTWDMGVTQNFTSADGETSDAFVNGDKVYFTDNAQAFNVSLAGEIEADSIIVDNTKAYTFTGTGSIIGKTVLVKRGTGNLTITTDNSYTGGTRISGGVVIVTSLSNANQAKGNLGSVVTNKEKFVIENGAELRTTAAVTQGSSMKMETDEGGVIQNTQDFIVNRAISGTKLTKKGTGWMKLNVENSELDTLTIAGGTVQCVSCNTPAKTVIFKKGTLNENTSTSYAIHVPKGGTGTQNLVNDATYSNKLTGEGTLTISCPVRSGGSGDNKWYATRTRITGNWSAFEGTVKPVSNGDPSGRFTLDNASGLAKGTFDIPAGVEVQNSGKTFAVGSLAGTGSLGGSCTFSNGSSAGANTWKVGNDDSWSWDGTVVSNANFTKVGQGRMVAKGVWTTTGNVKVSQGELAIGPSASLGTGSLTVDNGAILTGTTSSTNALKNKSITINGTLQVGTSKTSTSGTLNMGDINVTFGKTSTYVVGIARAATNTNGGGTMMKGIKRLTINGVIQVFLSENQILKEGDYVRLWEAESMTGTPTFDLPEIGNGLTWDTSHISEGLLYVVADTNNIDALFANSPKGCDIYNASGQLIRKKAHSLEGFPPGIYFVRGRKIVVKSPLR